MAPAPSNPIPFIPIPSSAQPHPKYAIRKFYCTQKCISSGPNWNTCLCGSDQKDPFSRSPLTLEMVQKHTELKERIQQWLAEVRAQKKS